MNSNDDLTMNILNKMDVHILKHINNGLLPRIWGPHAWKFIHCVTFGYPLNPSERNIKEYKQFFLNLGNVLPCGFCSKSYNEFIKMGDTKLIDDTFKTRYNLVKWGFDIHNAVNQKLLVVYGINFDDFVEKYESFRAKCDPNLPGCVMPMEQKIKSYTNEYSNECTVIPYNIAKCFENYAKSINVSFDKTHIYNNICPSATVSGKYCSLKNTDYNKEIWNNRNYECNNIIQYMRKNGISSIDPVTNLPSAHELELIARLCSNLNLNELVILINKLGFNVKKAYKFY